MHKTQHKKIQIYLFSIDFSSLSNPKIATPEISKILTCLKKFLNEDKVIFRFSYVHITEVAPVEAIPNIAAEKRAELIWDLCGTRAMIHPMQMMESEVQYKKISAFSDSGHWFPQIDNLLPENIRALHQKALSNVLGENHLNREQRRALKKKIHTRNGFTPMASELLAASTEQTVHDIIQMFPFTNEEARLAVGFFQRGIYREQTEIAMLRVLSDPRWLIKRIAASPDYLESFSGWLRTQGSNVIEAMLPFMIELQKLRMNQLKNSKEFEASIDSFDDPKIKNHLLNLQSAQDQQSADLRTKFWKKLFLSNVNSLANAVATDLSVMHHPVSTEEEAFKKFPSISAMIVVINHALRSATEEKPRILEASDFGDALHATYAPYVDIFRADGYMAAPIQHAVKRYGTRVIGKLRDLPDAINDALNIS